MEIPKAMILGLTRAPLDPEPPRHLYAEIILIEKSSDNPNFPLLYQLEESQVHQEDTLIDPSRLTDEMFAMLGEVVSIDRANKVVLLANGDRVSYKYLVLFSESRLAHFSDAQIGEFRNGLQALSDALRIKKSLNRPLFFEKAPEFSPYTPSPRQPELASVSGTLIKDSPSITSLSHVLQESIGRDQATSWSQMLNHVLAYEVQA